MNTLSTNHVTTNANLTGPIKSIGNATSVTSQSGTGTTFVMQESPILVTPNIGVATGTSLSVSGEIIVNSTPFSSGTTSISGGTVYATQFLDRAGTSITGGTVYAPTLTDGTTTINRGVISTSNRLTANTITDAAGTTITNGIINANQFIPSNIQTLSLSTTTMSQLLTALASAGIIITSP